MRVGDTIYLDYQATTPVDPRVITCMEPYFRTSVGNPHSNDHIVGWEALSAVEAAANGIASFIGADPDEVIFTSGATEANNLAVLGATRGSSSGRSRLLVGATEHKCVLSAARAATHWHSLTVETIPVDREGFIDLDWLESHVDDDVLLVSVMAVNNEIGTIQPLTRIAEITERHGAIFHTDAAQAPVATPLDVLGAKIDLLSLSGHKVYGPKGIGCLYIRRELQESIEPLIYGGGQQGNLRSGTVPVPLCVGMASAFEILSAPGQEEERRQLASKRNRFVDALLGSGHGVQINGPAPRHRHPGNANLRFPGLDAADLLNAVQPRIAASTGSACTSGIPEPSHVLRAIGLPTSDADSSVRFSLGRYSTDEDIREAVSLICAALEDLSSIPS